MDINKMMTNGIFTMNDKHTHSQKRTQQIAMQKLNVHVEFVATRSSLRTYFGEIQGNPVQDTIRYDIFSLSIIC